MLSGEFVLLMLGGGALAAAGASFLVPDSPVVGGVTFAIAAVLLLFAARPALRHRLERGISDQRAAAHAGADRARRGRRQRASTGTAGRSASGASCGRRGRSTTMT